MEQLSRQVQQQRWQPPAKRRNTSTSVLVTSFEPIAIDTLGIFNASARHLVDEIIRRISENSDRRLLNFVFSS